MKIKLITLLALCLIVGAAMALDHLQRPQVIKGSDSRPLLTVLKAPDISFKTLDNQAHTLNTMSEDLVLLHFWASWCASCIIEFPTLLEQVKKRDGQVALIAISIDNNKNDMLKLKDRLKKMIGPLVDAPHIYWVWDHDKAISLKQMNVVNVPETFFINRDGYIMSKVIGQSDWSAPMMDKKINLILGK